MAFAETCLKEEMREVEFNIKQASNLFTHTDLKEEVDISKYGCKNEVIKETVICKDADLDETEDNWMEIYENSKLADFSSLDPDLHHFDLDI